MRVNDPPKLAFAKGQGRDNECSLLAVCTAQGLNYLEHSDAFERAYGAGFGECCVKGLKPYRVLEYLRHLWGTQCVWSYESRPRGDGRRVWEHIPDLRGIGILAIKDLISGNRHAVAYENGWIYDGNAPRPMSYDMWAVCIQGEQIVDGWERAKTKEKK